MLTNKIHLSFYRCKNHTCPGYNCLPEDKPSGSKYVHVDDTVKN